MSLACCVSAQPTCSDPTNGRDTTCPSDSQCWDNSRTTTEVIWSLHDQCKTCTFAQQKSVIVQNTDTVSFKTDGTFQREQNLNIYRVYDLHALRDCDVSAVSLLGRVAPVPADGSGPPFVHTYSLDVTSGISSGVNYFLALDTGGSATSGIPDNCQQGARLIVYQGGFDCGDIGSPCSDNGSCVFSHDSSSFECQCPGGFSGPTCGNIDECFQNNACGDPISMKGSVLMATVISLAIELVVIPVQV